MKRFEGKTAVVTGAGGGVGRAAAVMLANEGARLVITDYAAENLNVTYGMIKDLTEAEQVVADISLEEGSQKFIDAAVARFGTIDVFMHIAAVYHHGAVFTNYTARELDQVLNINCRGAFLTLRNALRVMAPAKKGVVVICASQSGLFGDAYISLYSASKHFQVGLAKSIAKEYASQGIRVSCVCPACINTPMIEKELSTMDPKVICGPMQRPASPEEIADVMAYLASDSASYTNGAIVNVNGGDRI